MKYYVLGVWGDVQPMLSDPYDTEQERDDKARQWRRDNEMDEGGIYRLNIDSSGGPLVESYGGMELDPEEEIDVVPNNDNEDDKR